MTGIRFDHPEWVPENCTACGNCYTVCPDTAIPGLVNEVGQVFDTVVNRVRKNGHGAQIEHLPKAAKLMEQPAQPLQGGRRKPTPWRFSWTRRWRKTVDGERAPGQREEQLKKEFDLFRS